MVLAAINEVKRFIYLGFIGKIQVADLSEYYEEVVLLLADLPAGFRLLTDLSRVESMEPGCEVEIGRVMEVFSEKEISAIVRVIPSPHKDIGFNILSAFHYKRQVPTTTCGSMDEAARILGL